MADIRSAESCLGTVAVHMPGIQPTAVYRTPPCFICRQPSLADLSAHVAAALSAEAPVQDLLPEMPRPGREQLISGTHPACWAATFGHPTRTEE